MPIPSGFLLLLQLPFLPLLAAVLGRDLVAAGKRDNYPILLMVMLLAGCQAMTLWVEGRVVGLPQQTDNAVPAQPDGRG